MTYEVLYPTSEPMGGGPVIETAGLTKAYGRTRALDGLELRVRGGTVLAVLGPNGAGKTTMLRILATLTPPDRGWARVAGHDVVAQRHEVRRRISLTGQEVALDALQTGAENLAMIGRLRGLSGRDARLRARELLGEFGLVDAGGRRVGAYSGGMRRRLDLAAGLAVRPEVLFLDEPTTGLDPGSRKGVWAVIEALAASGVTVLLTTQHLEEADRLADQIAVMNHGRIVAQGSPGELKRRVAPRRLMLVLADDAGYSEVAARLGTRLVHADRPGLALAAAIEGAAAETRRLLDEVDPGRQRIASFTEREADLDDVFTALTSAPPGAAAGVSDGARVASGG